MDTRQTVDLMSMDKIQLVELVKARGELIELLCDAVTSLAQEEAAGNKATATLKNMSDYTALAMQQLALAEEQIVCGLPATTPLN